MNVTGGTKIAALAAFQAFFFADSDNRIIYCDTEHDRLRQLAPEISETPIDANLITANDYLACYGLPVHSGGQLPLGATAGGLFWQGSRISWSTMNCCSQN